MQVRRFGELRQGGAGHYKGIGFALLLYFRKSSLNSLLIYVGYDPFLLQQVEHFFLLPLFSLISGRGKGKAGLQL
ncbi:hypothetical protein ES703_106451 [subsurface metagenome]